MRSWSGAWIQALSSPSIHGHTKKRFLAQNSLACPMAGSVPGPATFKHFRCPWGAHHTIRAPHSATGGGQKLPPLPACSVSSDSGCLGGGLEVVGSAQRTPGCRAAAAKDVPGALWHQQSRETPHMTYFSARKDSWARLSSAEILPQASVQNPRCIQVWHSQSP